MRNVSFWTRANTQQTIEIKTLLLRSEGLQELVKVGVIQGWEKNYD